MTVAGVTVSRPGRLDARRLGRRHGWTVGIFVLLVALVLYWRGATTQAWGPFDVQSLAIDALPLALVAMGQAAVIISGGVDLSVGSMMSFVNVLAARWMVHMGFGAAIGYGIGLVLVGAAIGAVTGAIIVVSGVADIIVTLAGLFVLAGAALAVLQVPGGGAPIRFQNLVTLDTVGSHWVPSAIVLLAAIFVVLWVSIRRTRLGLAVYAIGSNRNRAYLSGVNVPATRIFAYAFSGAFGALGGLALTAASGIGDPNAGAIYTLNSVAAAVLGGVSLVGGVGGLIGPIAAALVLTLVKTLMIIKGVNQNWAQVFQGALIVVVVMVGGLAIRQRSKTS
jgi:ribose transport system permease protein